MVLSFCSLPTSVKLTAKYSLDISRIYAATLQYPLSGVFWSFSSISLQTRGKKYQLLTLFCLNYPYQIFTYFLNRYKSFEKLQRH